MRDRRDLDPAPPARRELQGLAAATGADLAWQIKKNLVFTPVKVLPDGSFHSVMRTRARTSVTARPGWCWWG
jgi:hypothetical protein